MGISKHPAEGRKKIKNLGEGVEGGWKNILVPLSRDKQTENFVSPEAQGRESSFFQASVPCERRTVEQTAMLSLHVPG